MSRATEDLNRRMLRARDVMDRQYAEPLDIPTLAAVAHVSPAHFIRSFRAVFGETPHRYLLRRRDPFGNHLRINQLLPMPVASAMRPDGRCG